MLSSHVDTVVDTGIHGGCDLVLGRLEIIQTLREAGGGLKPERPIVIAASANDEAGDAEGAGRAAPEVAPRGAAMVGNRLA